MLDPYRCWMGGFFQEGFNFNTAISDQSSTTHEQH